jgi:hypothetical protein
VGTGKMTHFFQGTYTETSFSAGRSYFVLGEILIQEVYRSFPSVLVKLELDIYVQTDDAWARVS